MDFYEHWSEQWIEAKTALTDREEKVGGLALGMLTPLVSLCLVVKTLKCKEGNG